jgi:hypothetical protein
MSFNDDDDDNDVAVAVVAITYHWYPNERTTNVCQHATPKMNEMFAK